MEILWISLIPTAIALIAAFGLKLDISLKELAIQIAGGFLVLGVVWAIGLNLSSLDKEVWNGRVIDKTVWKFSCHTNTSNPCTNGYSCHFHEECSGSVDPDLYRKIQRNIESGRSDFQDAQTKLIDEKRVYETNLGSPWTGFWLHLAGYPKVDMNKYKVIVSDHAAVAFETGRENPINFNSN